MNSFLQECSLPQYKMLYVFLRDVLKYATYFTYFSDSIISCLTPSFQPPTNINTKEKMSEITVFAFEEPFQLCLCPLDSNNATDAC